jgi:hypothetical protein
MTTLIEARDAIHDAVNRTLAIAAKDASEHKETP